jgi:acyl carrier protein
MDNTQARLAKCFLAVFPEMTPEEVAGARTASVKNWDSVASVTLFSLIEEEFGTHLSLDALDDFNSFERILFHLERSFRAEQ